MTQRDRLLEQVGGLAVLSRSRPLLPFDDELGEDIGIDRRPIQPRSVPRMMRIDDVLKAVAGKRLSQRGDVCLDQRAGTVRRIARPDHVDQTASRNDTPTLQYQRREDRAWLAAAQLYR